MEANQQQLNELIERMENRIDKLERTNRRWLRGFAALAVSAALAVPFIPTDTNAKKGGKLLVGERIALMGGPKKVGMLGSARGGMNKLSFHGPAGNTRLTLSTNQKGQPAITLYGPDKKPRLTLGYTKKHGAHWIMYGSDGKAIVKQLK